MGTFFNVHPLDLGNNVQFMRNYWHDELSKVVSLHFRIKKTTCLNVVYFSLITGTTLRPHNNSSFDSTPNVWEMCDVEQYLDPLRVVD